MPILGKLKGIFGTTEIKKKTIDFSIIRQNVNPGDFWKIVGELGDGAFGKVYKAEHKTQKTMAALKQVDIVEETDLEDYSVEIEILNQCKHKNIVGLHEAYLYGDKLWMYIEFCAGGAIDRIMTDLERPLTEREIRFVCREMCEALDFLHQNAVIHRDLKAGNVLLTRGGDVKIADFGVSAKNSSARQKRDSFIGTPYWMAPEVIVCETLKDTPYDYKVDIWSFGITLIEFAYMHPPNNEMHPMRVLLKIQKSEPPTLRNPSKWSAEFNDFIAKCLVKDPEQRLSANQLLQHSYIRNSPDKKPILDLLSEINAEVTVETKDVDEEDIVSTSDLSDSDSLSQSSGSRQDVPSSVTKPKVSPDSVSGKSFDKQGSSSEPAKVLAASKVISENVSVKNTAPTSEPIKPSAPASSHESTSSVLPAKHVAASGVPSNVVIRPGQIKEPVKPLLPNKTVDSVPDNKSTAKEAVKSLGVSKLVDSFSNSGREAETLNKSTAKEPVKSQEVRKMVDNWSNSGREPEALSKSTITVGAKSGPSVSSDAKTAAATVPSEVKPAYVARSEISLPIQPQSSVVSGGNKLEGASGARSVQSATEDGIKRYKTMTKIRKYVRDGEVVVDQTSKIVDVDQEEKRKRQQLLWIADMNEMKRIQKLENRQVQQIDDKLHPAVENIKRKCGQDTLLHIHNRNVKVEECTNTHRATMEQMTAKHFTECRDLEQKLQIRQEQEYKAFLEKLHTEMKSLKREVESLPKDRRKEILKQRKEQKTLEHAEKERKFKEQQEEKKRNEMNDLSAKHRKEIEPQELTFLHQKHQLMTHYDNEIAKLEQQAENQQYEETEKNLTESYHARVEYLKARHTKEKEQMKRNYDSQVNELTQLQALEKKRLPKLIQNEKRLRSQQYRDSVRQSTASLPLQEHEWKKQFNEAEKQRQKEEMEKLDARHKKQSDVLTTDYTDLLKEHDQAFVEKFKILASDKEKKLAELRRTHEDNLKKLKEKAAISAQRLEEDYKQQMNLTTDFYSRTSPHINANFPFSSTIVPS